MQWCHGSPGVIITLCKAYQTFGHDRYLSASRNAAEDIWRRGLLRKGLGLCHGMCGNAYSFLALYRVTGEEKYLGMAAAFAYFSCGPASEDFQYSNKQENLFNGIAGAVLFFSELLSCPDKACFPIYELF